MIRLPGWLPNLVGFQLVWTAAVGGAAQGWWWAGPAAVLLFAAMQLRWSQRRRSDLGLLLLSIPLGFLVDSAWVQLGWMRFAASVPWTDFAPVWIVAMWCGFVLTLNHSLASLKPLPWLAALLGVLGGPLAYFAAERAWGAVAISPGWLPYIGLAVAWGVITPLLLQLADRLDRPTQRTSA